MWTGIVNGQPFFFSDTTNYIRAADLAVHLASGRTLATVWTDRYRSQLPGASPEERSLPERAQAPSANDLRAGLVMSGRSPYIGLLMYVGWVTGWFWPFVVLQAFTAYYLILIVLSRFGLERPSSTTAVTFGLAATTALPTYNSLLLADGFASFGVLAFALAALPGELSRKRLIFLTAVLVVAITAHLTHLMMLIGMVAVVGLLTVTRLLSPPRRAWLIGIGTILVGFGALQVTEAATRMAVGREPQLLPLLTARFYADGPGRKYIETGCDHRRFQVCRLPIKNPVNNAGWLFDTNPEVGAYMLATADQRRLMGQEDVAFAWAVVRKYPFEQAAASIGNTIRQFAWIDYDGLNQGCGREPTCWEVLPTPVRATFDRSLSGRSLWPQAWMNAVLYGVVALSLIALAVALPFLRRGDPTNFLLLRNLLLIAAGGMVVCCFFGGAVADPQYRYQGRLVWIVVLFAAVAVLAARRVHESRERSSIGGRSVTV